jgi:hypothetical protein
MGQCPRLAGQYLDNELNGENKNPFWARFEHKEMESMPHEPVASSAIKYAMIMD